MMTHTITSQISIPKGCNGPAHSANGGYVSGLLGQRIDGPTEVILHAPPPLETSLSVVDDAKGVQLKHEDILLAEAASCSFDLAPLPPPTLNQAREARKRYVGFRHHDYPTCFVCGVDRISGDGLCLYCGALDDQQYQLVACDWTPGTHLAGDDGLLEEIYIWCALDCPGAQAKHTFTGEPYGYVVRLAVDIIRRPSVTDPLIVTGWLIDSDGRKHTCGTALFTQEGDLLARGRALWIDLKKQE